MQKKSGPAQCAGPQEERGQWEEEQPLGLGRRRQAEHRSRPGPPALRGQPQPGQRKGHHRRVGEGGGSEQDVEGGEGGQGCSHQAGAWAVETSSQFVEEDDAGQPGEQARQSGCYLGRAE